ncbi:MAG: alpha/beta fold hydrolase [Elusimicrobiota bacterium]|jgi:pimeloyl-ACP methyl ester carboxylesterase
MQARINGVNMSLRDEGPRSGLPVVLVHGFPLSHAMWELQIEALKKDFRVVAYDIRGLGASAAGDGQCTMELFSDDLLAVLDHLGIASAVLCGLSMGGYVALRTAQRAPQRVKALVLCDTRSEADDDPAKLGRAAAIQSIKRHGLGPFADGFVPKVFAAETLAQARPCVAAAQARIRASDPVGVCGALLAMLSRTDTSAFLPQIKAPCLVMVGEHDRLTPPEYSRGLAAAIPGAELEVIPAAAHMSNLENPERFNARLLEFLGGI